MTSATATRAAAGARWRLSGPRRRLRASRLETARPPGPRGPSARLTPWAWVADGILAFVLVAATLVAARDGGSLVIPRVVPFGVDAPAPPEQPSAVPPGPGGVPAPAGPIPGGVVQGPNPVQPPEPADRPHPAEVPSRPGGADRGAMTVPQPGDLSLRTVPFWQLAAAVLIALPLVTRRWRPLAAYWVVLAATVIYHRGVLVEDAVPFTLVALLVAAYSAAVYSPHRALAVTSVLVGAVEVIAFPNENLPDFRPVYAPFIALVLVGLTANAFHLRQQRAQAAAAEQTTASRRAVEQERARIARELHDVVTHNVSVMIIQAGAARKVLAAAPEQAREAMLAVESSGRAAMTELRHVMGLLTMPASDPGTDPAGGATGPAAGAAAAAAQPAAGGRRVPVAEHPATGDDGWRSPATLAAGERTADDELTPQPGLGQLPALVGRVRAAGVAVELATAGTPVELPPGIDLAAFRVVQEGLTNAVRHAAGARVRIVVGYRPGVLSVDVTDSGGRPGTVAGPGGGAGLVGLRERLAVYGGSLRAGRRPLGGFGLRAEIPLPAGPGGAEPEPAAEAGSPAAGPASARDGSA